MSDRTPKTVAILQSNYIPWKGYFDIIAAVDEFIIYDDVQYTKNDWRNRNRIKTPDGIKWITIPVYHSTSNLIQDTKVSQPNWASKHWKMLQQNYSRSGRYRDVKDFIEHLYHSIPSDNLSEINCHFLVALCNFLGIRTRLTRSTDYPHSGDKSERVLQLCQAAGATSYLSGASAQNYLNLELFRAAGITVEWIDYANYPEYPQLHPPFCHEVSILDLILNCGTDAVNYLKYSRK